MNNTKFEVKNFDLLTNWN